MGWGKFSGATRGRDARGWIRIGLRTPNLALFPHSGLLNYWEPFRDNFPENFDFHDLQVHHPGKPTHTYKTEVTEYFQIKYVKLFLIS